MVSPWLYILIQKCGEIEKKRKRTVSTISVFIIFLLVSVLLTLLPPIPKMFGGSQYVLGGSYLIIYLLGMYIGNNRFMERLQNITKRAAVLLTFTTMGLSVVWTIYTVKTDFVLEKKIFPRWTLNPPGISIFIHMILIALFTIGLCSLLKDSKSLSAVIVRPMQYIGKHSLDIFMYHMLIINLIRNHLGIVKEFPILHAITVWGLSLMIPSIGRDIYEYLKRRLIRKRNNL